MAGKPTYNELEREIKQLEKEVLEYLRKAKELNKKRKVTERSHIRRTMSLMHINKELRREIKELKRSETEELGLVSHRLRERIKEDNSQNLAFNSAHGKTEFCATYTFTEHIQGLFSRCIHIVYASGI